MTWWLESSKYFLFATDSIVVTFNNILMAWHPFQSRLKRHFWWWKLNYFWSPNSTTSHCWFCVGNGRMLFLDKCCRNDRSGIIRWTRSTANGVDRYHQDSLKSISFKSNLENHLPTKFPQMSPMDFYCYEVRVSKFWAHKTRINKLF